jgi:hypothetical protein
MVKLITTTWSYEDSYDIKNTFLYKSFIKNNPPSNFIHIHYNRNNYIELENEFIAKYDYQYEYLLYKIFLTKDKIKDIDADYLIFSDTSDVVCLGDINTIEPPNSILMSSEINQYPSSMGDWGGLEYSSDEILNRHFLNSGLYITSKQNYIDLLNSIIENIFPKNLKSFKGDQGVFIYHYLSKYQPEIILDKENKLFFSTFSKDHNNFLNYKFPMFVHDNGWDWGSPRFIEKFNLI